MDDVSLAEWLRFFFAGWGLVLTGYVALQALFIAILKGRARYWVAVPAPIMVLVLLFTYYAYVQESNLWPMILILATPMALLYVLAIGVGCLIDRKAATRRGAQRQGE
jgi:hypothetical protein